MGLAEGTAHERGRAQCRHFPIMCITQLYQYGTNGKYSLNVLQQVAVYPVDSRVAAGGDHRVPFLRSEWKCHQFSHLLSHHHLRRPGDKMKLPKSLRLPISHRPNRSKARSEVGPVECQTEVGPAAPRPTESSPDLRVGTSISPAPSPLTSRDQGSNGMNTFYSR